MNDHETLLASARTLREIATAFGDWTRSADTARLDELIRLRRATWLGALLAVRGIATFEATERSAAIVHRLLARDLRSAQREIGELLDGAFTAGGIVATATATTRKRREAERVRDAAITAIANDGTVRDVRGDVAALLACADDLERMLATSAEIATLDPAAVERAVSAALVQRVDAIVEDLAERLAETTTTSTARSRRPQGCPAGFERLVDLRAETAVAHSTAHDWITKDLVPSWRDDDTNTQWVDAQAFREKAALPRHRGRQSASR
ncbi:MAG: hypothetical protein IT457_09825 [Planctomycetes bacterium]|nr:hypothetical protein [Planctomycetota bacterium]